MTIRSVIWGAALLTSVCSLSCNQGGGLDNIFSKAFWTPQPTTKPATLSESRAQGSKSLAVRDTIGEITWVEGLRLMKVRGYGLVVGLGENGSGECPKRVRDVLVTDIYKRQRVQGTAGGKSAQSPEAMIDSRDTAAVVVEGEIPAAALANARFDLTVSALSGTQTTSLEGGYLLPCDLRVFRTLTDSTISLEGQILATGAGPVFVNPFASQEDAATQSDPRHGVVMGGGRSHEDRRLRLVLTTPSYQNATHVRDRINERFGKGKMIADAISPAIVQLNVPEEFRNDEAHYLALIRRLYIRNDEGFMDRRKLDLAEEIASSEASCEDVSLAWEGIGRSALPVIRELYGDDREPVAFYAARAGIRLDDDLAVEAIEKQAMNPSGNYRIQAIAELSRAKRLFRTGRVLQKLLSDDDPRICVLAYEGLLHRDCPAIRTLDLDGGRFTIDLVDSEGPHLVYAKRSQSPRIAIFGDQVRCRTPVFYRHPRGDVMLNAYSEDETITLVRQIPGTTSISPPIRVRPELTELIRVFGETPRSRLADGRTGLGLDYAQVVNVVSTLCEDNSINAKFILEGPDIGASFLPQEPTGERPESEL